MDDMVRCAQRGWDILLRAAVPLLIGGVVWAGLNAITAGLLTGPALVGLFIVALKTHQGKTTDVADVLAAPFGDVAAPLLAGIGFYLPFGLADFLADELGRVPLIASVCLAAWFAIGVHVFAGLADRPEDGLGAAVRRAWAVAESRGGGRLSGLAMHLLYGVAAFLVIALGSAIPQIGGLTRVITVPAVVCLLAAWHAHAALPSEPTVEVGSPPEDEPELLEATEKEPEPKPVAEPRKPRRKTPSRRPATVEPDDAGDA